MSRLFANNRATTLSGNITALQTNIPVTNGSAFPEITGADTFFVTLDNGAGVYEILLCTAHSAGGTTLTCTRGQDGTAATTWSAGDLIEMRVVAKEYEEFVAETDATVNLTGDLTVDGTVSFPNVPLDVPSGGTGKQSHTANALLVGAGTLDVAELLPAGDGTPKHVLATSDGVAWASQSTDDVVTSAVIVTALTGNPLPVAQGGTGLTTLTANNVILGDGTNDVKLVAPGTSGNVLTSNGTTWTSTALPAESPRGYVKYTANDTFVVPAGVTTVWVTAQAGGGGGAGASGGQVGYGGRAGSAAYRFAVSVTPGAAKAVTIGVGGSAGGAPGSGGAGTATSFSTDLSLSGGAGGPALNASTVGVFTVYGEAGLFSPAASGAAAANSGGGGAGCGVNGGPGVLSGNAGGSGFLIVEWGLNN